MFSRLPSLPGRGAADFLGRELEALTLAEQQGYDAAWLGEPSPSRYGIAPAVLHGAASLSSKTQRIRIGLAVTVLPFFHPLRIAEELAMLDLMSSGRLDCGIRPGELPLGSNLGADLEQGQRVLQEQLEVVKEAWVGLPFSHQGEFFDFPTLECFPSTEQEPHPPLFVMPRGREDFDWACEQGYPVLAEALEAKAALDRRSARQAVGASPFALCMPVYVGATQSRARAEAEPALVAACQRTSGGDSEPSSELLLDQHSIVGDAAYCRDEVARLCEQLDLDCLLAWQDFGNLSQELSLASQQRFIEQVAPEFR